MFEDFGNSIYDQENQLQMVKLMDGYILAMENVPAMKCLILCTVNWYCTPLRLSSRLDHHHQESVHRDFKVQTCAFLCLIGWNWRWKILELWADCFHLTKQRPQENRNFSKTPKMEIGADLLWKQDPCL